MRRGAPLSLEVRAVEDIWHPGSPDRWVQPEWAVLLPWVVQGATARRRGGGPSDFALFAGGSPTDARARWASLGQTLGFSGIHHSRQVHGRDVLVHSEPAQGLQVDPDADGHATGAPGVLMCVTVADCVPVYVVDPVRMATALLHAGWRGVAAGVLERGLKTLERCFGSKAEELLLHLGPAICGACYEVGPEVHRALGLPDPGEPAAVDLRGVLAARATATGVDPARITRSAQCTRCGDSPFFSHRRGDPERQVGYLGIRPGVPTSLTEPRPPTPCEVPTEPSAPTVPHGEQ